MNSVRLNARVMMSAVRFAIVWLAAWCQIFMVATMPLETFAAGAVSLGSLPICHADADNRQPSPSVPSHTSHDCVLCVVCQSHSGSIALLPPTPVPALRRAVAPARFDIAQPRAPPPSPTIAAQPRGPPSLI